MSATDQTPSVARGGAAASVDLPADARSLLEPALRRLRVGETQPLGWLKRELQLQARGITSQLPLFWHYLNQSKWMGTGGSEPEQFLPYYLNGLIPLSYQLPEEDGLGRLRDQYVSHILSAQASIASQGGWLGPAVGTSATASRNYWSKYPAVEAFESYAEAAPPEEAARVVGALVAHHRAFHAQLEAQAPSLNGSRWGFARHEDGIAGIEWLLDGDRGGQGGGNSAFLWELAEMLHVQSDAIMEGVPRELGGGYTWQQWFVAGDPFSKHDDGEPTGTAHLLRHGVDIGQAMKLGALLWRDRKSVV